jgi:hypothetical protein
MLRDGLDVYLPVIDNHGVDMVVKRPDGVFAEVQIKARSREAKCPAFFPDIRHARPIPRYWFIFYAAHFDTMFLLSSHEFYLLSGGEEQDEKEYLRQIRFDGRSGGKPCIQLKYQKYIATNFNRILEED